MLRTKENLVFLLLLTPFLMLYAVASGSVEDWEKLRDESGIAVWVRPSAAGPLPEVRARVVIAASIEEVLAVLAKDEGYTDWMYRCIESRVIEHRGGEDRVVYTRTDLPWPVSDRDAVLDVEVDYEEGSAKAEITYRTGQHSEVPPVPGVVRIPRMVGGYSLHEFSPGRTEVVYVADADMGGSLPGWIVEAGVAEQPFDTLVGLRRTVEVSQAR